MEVLKLVLTKFTDETITIFGLLLITSLCLFVIMWLLNRKRFHDMGHQIPASVVKNYLDTIIQNSNSLKSSLFRGGGLDLSDAIPAVFPLGGLPSSGVEARGPSSEELNQKNAEIALLNNKVVDREKMLKELEKRLSDLQNAKGGEESKIFQDEIKSLQEKLAKTDAELQAAKANSGGGGDPEALKKLDDVTKDRDNLKERLAEYEIIEEDLANLKRLQQENEQLKKSLAALQGGAAAPVAVAPVAAAPVPTPVPEPVVAAAEAPPEEDLEAAMAAAIAESKPAPAVAPVEVAVAAAPEAVPAVVDEQKSAEELLSEFEKMLG